MRKYDIAYVPNGPVNYYPSVPLQDMSLEEIIKKYIKTCGKANGNVSECSKCKTPCPEGKRAVQLVANRVYNDPPIPLYGGKTLIEKAREENLKRKKEKEQMKETKKRSMLPEGWWEDSLASGDQVQWMIDNMGISRTQAKKKIYSYRYRNGLTDKTYNSAKKEPKVEETVEPKAEPEEKPVKTVSFGIEDKVEQLMKLQEQQKIVMEKRYKEYEEAKAKYEETKRKVDTLCNAADILNEV